MLMMKSQLHRGSVSVQPAPNIYIRNSNKIIAYSYGASPLLNIKVYFFFIRKEASFNFIKYMFKKTRCKGI